MADYLSTRWWHEKGADRAHCVVDLVEEMSRHQSYRRTRALEGLSLYEGKRIPALNAHAYGQAGAFSEDGYYDTLRWNIPRSLCQTVQAKISGKNKPKVQFVVTDGDWSAKRKAKKLDKFVEGQMHLPQGGYADSWQLMQAIVLDAVAIGGGCGIAKVFADYDSNKVVVERVSPWEVYVDPQDARHCNPRSIYHRYPYDRDALAAKFPGKKSEIDAARKLDSTELDYFPNRSAEQVWVYEAWHLGDAGGKGVHCLCVDGAELSHEDWTRDDFPFLILRWSRELMGYWAQSLTEEVAQVNNEVNFTLERMQEAERKLSNGVLIVQRGSVSEEEVTANDIGKVVWVERGADFPPQYTAPQAYSESTLNWLKLNTEKEFELTGVSAMSATSRKEQGVTAAVAMRTLADIETERFSVFYGAYEQAFVDMARLIVRATRDLAEETDDVIVRWPGQSFLQQISWQDVDLPEDMYVIRPYAVSGMKNTPADRLSLAQDLVSMGSLAPDAFNRVVQYLDTPGEFARVNRQREWVGKLIEEWLDADPDDESFVFHPPIKFMILEDALLQVAEEYFAALMDDVPDYNANFFLIWLEECDRLIQEKAAKAAELQAVASGAAPPPQEAPMPSGPAPGAEVMPPDLGVPVQ